MSTVQFSLCRRGLPFGINCSCQECSFLISTVDFWVAVCGDMVKVELLMSGVRILRVSGGRNGLPYWEGNF